MSEKEYPSFEFVFGGFKQKGIHEKAKPVILPHTNRYKSTNPRYSYLDYHRKTHPLKPGKLCKKVFPEDYEQESQNQNNDLELGK